jgi:hypothetical protein
MIRLHVGIIQSPVEELLANHDLSFFYFFQVHIQSERVYVNV